MRPAVLEPVRAALVVGPTVMAFATGGGTDAARTTGLIAAWVLVALAAAAGSLPRTKAAATAIVALAALTGWTALSVGWAPLGDVARDDVDRLVLYLGVLLAAALAFDTRQAARAVEPLLLAGTATVALYALSGHAGLIDVTETLSANGRLDQPITYWNGLGALAAVGAVLAARVAGDRDRATAVRACAAAAAVPLLTTLVLTYSRGALAALAGGFVVLLVLAPTWSQLRAAAIVAEAGALGVALGLARDELLLALPGAMAIAAATTVWAARTERDGTVRLGRLPLPSRPGVLAALACAALVLVPVLAGIGDSGAPNNATASRFAAAGTNRDEYWSVALRTFADHPLRGIGTGGFAVAWQQRRTLDESARDAHSIELEALAELGLPGALLLILTLTATALAARAVQRVDPVLAAGPAAALTAWLLHASLDWDWELPGVSLPAVVLAGTLLRRAG